MSSYLCFDLGTTKIKSSLIGENGEIIYLSEVEAKTYYEGDAAYQKPDEYFKVVIGEIKKIREKYEDEFKKAEHFICSGQMAGILGIDKNWKVAFPWTYSVDTRYSNYLFEIEKKIGDKIRKYSGGVPTMAAKILWIKDSYPEDYKKIYKFINLTTYVSGKICNLKVDRAFIDYSCLAMNGLADIKEGKWSSSICNELRINVEKLPNILRPFECIGYIDKDKFGTEKDIEVLVGCGDQIAGFIGAGIINNSSLVDVAGTYTVLGYCTSKFIGDYKNKIISSIFSGIDDIYYQIAVINAGGYTYNWFSENFSYDSNNNKRFKTIKDSKGLYFIPHIGGRYNPPQPYFEGSWIGIKWEHDLDSFYVSILESIGYEFNYILNYIKKLNNLKKDIFSEIRVIGGGSKNILWNKIKSSILNLKYIKMRDVSFEVIGTFLIAKYKNNIKEGCKELIENKVVSIDKIINPDKEKVEFYKKYKENYIEIVNKLEEIYYKLNVN